MTTMMKSLIDREEGVKYHKLKVLSNLKESKVSKLEGQNFLILCLKT